MDKIIDKIQKLTSSLKADGVCLVNSQTGSIEHSYALTDDVSDFLKNESLNKGFSNLNSQINLLVSGFGFPELLMVKSRDMTGFVKFVDDSHLVYFCLKGTSVNYSKIKTTLNTIFNAG